MPRQPNIVVVMADQLAPQFTGTYGHGIVRTPHLDALAARGTRFDAAYCGSPLCAPSRASFMTGMLPSRIGAFDNAAELPSSIPTFAHHLRNAGYRTCLSGKMHFVGADQLHGFEERLTTDVYPADHAWTPDWENPDERIDKWYHNMDSVLEAGTAATTFQIEYDDEVAFLARRRIFEFAMTGASPFCMVVSFTHPHDPYVARPEWWDLYEGAEIDIPTGTVADDPHSKRIARGVEADRVVPTEDQIRRSRRAYFANVSYIDDKLGEIVRTLEEARLLDDTIIVFTADHGDMLGERGLWYKMSFFEHSARVPLVLAGPGVRCGAISEPCSLMDLLPTFVDIAASSEDVGSAPPALPETVDGRSLWPLLTGALADDPDGGEAIGEYCAECASHPLMMIRRGRWKYVHCEADPAQLFDIAADPSESRNLATDPEHAARVDAFEAEIRQRWDTGRIRADVLASQRRRRVVHAAMETGALTSWDYQPRRDAAQEFVRNHIDWTEAAEKTRFPRFDGDRRHD